MDGEQTRIAMAAYLRRVDWVLKSVAVDIEGGRLRFAHATIEQVTAHLSQVNAQLAEAIGAKDTVVL
jgi:hypothetical protein